MQDRDDLECSEHNTGGLLSVDVLDLSEGELSKYEVVKQRVE